MSQPTNRDRIWSAVLELAVHHAEKGRGFNIPMVLEEAGLEDSQRRTAQRVVGVMDELGWIEPYWTDRRSVRLWHPGDRLAAAAVDADDQELGTAGASEGDINGGSSPTGEDELAAVDFPAGRDRQECEAAVLAAAEYIRAEGGAMMRELVQEVGLDAGHDCGYDLPDLEPGERYRGGWWRSIVRPGLEALPDVEPPAPGGSEWKPV